MSEKEKKSQTDHSNDVLISGDHPFWVTKEFYKLIVAALDTNGSLTVGFKKVAKETGFQSLVIQQIGQHEMKRRRALEDKSHS